MGDAYSAAPGSPDPPWFNAVLEVIEQFELASIGLVAWELFLGEDELVPAWRQAMSTGLIERVGRCPYTREPMYRLADREPAGSVPATPDLGLPVAPGRSTPVVRRRKRATAAIPERDESAQPI